MFLQLMIRHNFLIPQLKPHLHHLTWLPWEGCPWTAYLQPIHVGSQPCPEKSGCTRSLKADSFNMSPLLLEWCKTSSFLPLDELNILTALQSDLPPAHKLWQYFGASRNHSEHPSIELVQVNCQQPLQQDIYGTKSMCVLQLCPICVFTLWWKVTGRESSWGKHHCDPSLSRCLLLEYLLLLHKSHNFFFQSLLKSQCVKSALRFTFV